MNLANYDGRFDCSSLVDDNFVSLLLRLLFVLLSDVLFGRWLVPSKGNVQLAKSSKGRHSWSKEHKRYDQPAMKNMRNANNSRRDINCHWRAPPSSGVALPWRVFAITKWKYISSSAEMYFISNLFYYQIMNWDWYGVVIHIHLPAITWIVARLPLSEAGDVILLTLLALEGRRESGPWSAVANGDWKRQF